MFDHVLTLIDDGEYEIAFGKDVCGDFVIAERWTDMEWNSPCPPKHTEWKLRVMLYAVIPGKNEENVRYALSRLTKKVSPVLIVVNSDLQHRVSEHRKI